MTERSPARVGVLLSVAALLTGCDTPSTKPPASADRSQTVRTKTPTESCRGGVQITAGPVDGALGLRALGLELRNCGTVAYRVQGYPVIRMLDGQRRPLDVTVGNGSEPVSAPDSYDAPPRPVLLRPGETAQARVLWRNTVTGSATTGTYLQVAPAAGEPAQLVAPSGGIDIGTTGRLAVNAWRASRD